MLGSSGKPQRLPGQVSRPDTWCILATPVGQPPGPDHPAKRIGAVAAPERRLGEGQELHSLFPGHGIEVGQDLVQ